MANLKEIRSRITSVGSTMQITSAMKMVSAAKLKRAQDAVTQMRPYANKLTELLVNLNSTLDSSDGGIYSEKRDLKKVLLVTITSNRGLCGGFNANIIKKAKSLMDGEYKGVETDIISIGKKSSENFDKNGYNVPVFEVRISKDAILYDQNKDLLKQEKALMSVDGVNGPDLVLGSMTEVSTNGNWPTTYDAIARK